MLCWVSLLGRTTDPAAFGGKGLLEGCGVRLGDGGVCAVANPPTAKVIRNESAKSVALLVGEKAREE
ncbi:MAG: hypothetical protein ABR501_10980 [Pyrinomonadaceae bacterium]